MKIKNRCYVNWIRLYKELYELYKELYKLYKELYKLIILEIDFILKILINSINEFN